MSEIDNQKQVILVKQIKGYYHATRYQYMLVLYLAGNGIKESFFHLCFSPQLLFVTYIKLPCLPKTPSYYQNQDQNQ